MMGETIRPFAPNQIKRLLIRSTNWIGDAVMTTPAVRAIRQSFPNASIHLLAKPWVAPVFQHSDRIDELLIFDVQGRHDGVSGILRLAKELRGYRFDAAILLQNAVEAALIAFLAGIPNRIGYDTDGRRLLLTHPVRRHPEHKHRHQTGYYLDILRGIGLPGGPAALELPLGRNDKMAAVERMKTIGVDDGMPVVGINPGAAFGTAKRWPTERYAELADRIRETYRAHILIFGGPGDRPIGETIARHMERPPVNLAGSTSLGEAMALIDRCDLFVTNDSGPMHVAAALDTPLVAIFGSTDPVATGPFSGLARVVVSDEPCRPCLKPVCPEGHFNCMNGITVNAVFREVAAVL